MSLTEDEDSLEDSRTESSQGINKFANKPYDAVLVLSVTDSFENNKRLNGIIRNQKYDEALELSHSGSDISDTISGFRNERLLSAARNETKELLKINTTHANQSVPNSKPTTRQVLAATAQKENVATAKKQFGSNHIQHAQKRNAESKSLESEESSNVDDDNNDDDEDDESTSYENLEGAYNASDFDGLSVAPEVKDLFQYITRFKPHEVELVTTLKCFVPEYIAAIGEIDAFIKIPRPDGQPDDLGTKFLDEPSQNQSDPTVLELQLRAATKMIHSGDVVVRSIDQATKQPAAIDKWIQSITELHASKPPPQVVYRNDYPDIDTLMQVWPESFENVLENTSLPSPDLDMPLPEYAKLLCSLLDIPTYNNPTESLHVMFNLYWEFKNNPHFQSSNLNGAGGPTSTLQSGYYGPEGGVDVLDLDDRYSVEGKNGIRK